MSIKDSHDELLSKPARCVPPEEWKWLDHIIRQLEYDEYMDAQRELWLWERPSKKNMSMISCFPRMQTQRAVQS